MTNIKNIDQAIEAMLKLDCWDMEDAISILTHLKESQEGYVMVPKEAINNIGHKSVELSYKAMDGGDSNDTYRALGFAAAESIINKAISALQESE